MLNQIKEGTDTKNLDTDQSLANIKAVTQKDENAENHSSIANFNPSFIAIKFVFVSRRRRRCWWTRWTSIVMILTFASQFLRNNWVGSKAAATGTVSRRGLYETLPACPVEACSGPRCLKFVFRAHLFRKISSNFSSLNTSYHVWDSTVECQFYR